MVFSSYIFIFVFLPLVLIGYFLLANVKKRIFQRLLLIFACLIFYGYYNVKYLILIIISILVNYFFANLIQVNRKKIWFVIGILFNVALLGYFKYYDFFIENINYLFSTDFTIRNIVLPLGISFFTFQQISFLVSVWKREEKVERFDDYCIFVLFFPQLIAGPIVLYSEMIPQFKDSERRYINWDNLSRGIYLFCIGLFKKVVIADTVALFVDNGFSSTELGFWAAWVVSLSYTLQIYFDFSGYSDMAIGLGKMFNIDIPENFRSPYRSESVTVFWRRWHITLGRALSTYIYKPLGGNRRGKGRTYINLMITFFVSGLWHGAAWTFVLWGVLHGAFVVTERMAGSSLERIPQKIRVFITFLVVNALWVLFRAENFTQALMVYRGMVHPSLQGMDKLADIAFDGIINFPTSIDVLYVFSILFVLLFIVWKCKNSITKYKTFKTNWKSVIFTAMLFCISLLHLSKESIFIYFNF